MLAVSLLLQARIGAVTNQCAIAERALSMKLTAGSSLAVHTASGFLAFAVSPAAEIGSRAKPMRGDVRLRDANRIPDPGKRASQERTRSSTRYGLTGIWHYYHLTRR